ncbi:NAD(P) transhydrogenase subunit alpha [Dethiobacter alkaliphilus]|uniref:proton-translocating NAD(P)(+) transhydrogenase n=1 Tax=Dethiobacter alkaliphilus AHT 1 TaxID=555088 RepID=C0GFJ6_DETAL|nr:NAD(P) transhydrogenase subunit alpha [Dethiobacter alkaliphilus]EEG77956.1 NAD(P)(+) transhydrogenase (AB-specific) [Dethiobacter alkaliphilus AHT 1]
MANLQFSGLVFGIPKEIMSGERRVSANPDTIEQFIAGGAKVLVEQGAGEGSFIRDEEYVKVGAEICREPMQVFGNADIILKVKEPAFNEIQKMHEADMMHAGQALVTFLHPAAPANHNLVKTLAEKGILSLTLDSIPRISRAQEMDALTSMSTVAGYKSVLFAANTLTKFVPMTGTAVGMIKPATALIIGAGVAGLQAAATAKRLGAVVYATDIRPDALEHAKSLGVKVIETGIPHELTTGQGGYAKNLPEEWLLKERAIIRETVVNADIVIGSALVPGKVAPILITEEMVKQMKPGSVIIDISIDQGGNCDLTVGGEIVRRYDVTIDGTKNIPGMVPTTSTWMFARNIYNFVSNLLKDGKLQINLEDEIISSSIVTKDGEILHAGAREAMGLD